MRRVLPILFNTEMVTAILDGRKTVTRLLVRPQPRGDMKHKLGYCISSTNRKDIGKFGFGTSGEGGHILCVRPPVSVGDILYVRETWKCWRAHRYEATADIMYKAGGEGIRLSFANGSTDSADRYDYDRFAYKWHGQKWHPSIHMPKEAARIWLKVTYLDAGRLQDMTLDDFLNEGVRIRPEAFNDPDNAYMQAKSLFAGVWDSTVAKKGDVPYAFDKNPWVWVMEFERCEKPEPCILKGMEPAEDKSPCIGYGDEWADEPCEMCKGCRQCTGND